MERDGSWTEAADLDPHRAQGYALLAALLARPPDAALLLRLRALSGDGTPFGEALSALGRAARAEPAEVEREFNRLFIGLGRGELVPYASFYLTGFLQDRPLIRIRQDMERLALARAPGVPEPEDHVAVLLETMAGLIDGRFGAPAPLSEQRRFFDRHLAAWAPRFFEDLERSRSAAFYIPVGTLGRLLLDIERDAFALERDEEHV